MNRYLKLFLAFALVFVFWNLHTSKSLAIGPPVACADGIYCPPPGSGVPTPNLNTRYMPDPNDFTQGGNVYLVVARCDASNPPCNGAHQLNAQSSTIRMFVRQKTIGNSFSFTIHGGDAPCGSQDDMGSSNNTNFTMQTLMFVSDSVHDPWNGGTGGHSVIVNKNTNSTVLTSSQAGCGNYKVTIPSSDCTSIGTAEYDGWCGFQFTATLTSGIGWNSFYLSSTKAFFSYYSNDNDSNADHFAVKAKPGSGYGNFKFPFAPNCSVNAPTKFDLKWFDADAGQPNQGGPGSNPIHTILNSYSYDASTGKYTEHNAVNLNIYANPNSNPDQNKNTDGYEWGTGGGNGVGGYFRVLLNPGWVYSWQWNHVYENNGVQFKLPFDSFNAYAGAGPRGGCGAIINATFTCTATPVATDPTNTMVRVSVTNQGPDPAGKGFQLRQTPTAQRWPTNASGGFSSNFTAGGTASFVFTRSPNATENYTLYDGTSGVAAVVGHNPLCSTSGIFTVTCNSSAPDPAEVGQTGTFKYSFNFVNTTSNNVAVTFAGSASPAGSLTNLSPPNPPTYNVIAGSSPSVPVSISALMNSSGTLTATATYNGITYPCPAQTTVAALPYFQVWNGDASSGGGFASANNSPFINIPYSCGTANDPAYVTTGSNTGYSYPLSGSQYSGSIIGFGEQANNRGSRVDFGAVAMGLIPGSNAGPVGFFSGSTSAGKQPVFANNIAGYGTTNMGGHLNGYAPNQCVKDYYTDSLDTSTAKPSQGLQTDVTNPSCQNNSCQLTAGSSVKIGSAGTPCTITVSQGQQLSLYVNGDVTIYCNIVYQKNFNPTAQGNIPYLAIIAKGNITVDGSVSELDGLYVAQPTGDGASTTDGNFYTCDPAAASSCNNQLVVNGAVIAQQVQLLRSHGTLDNPAAGSPVNGNPAEIFNFVPSMVIGEPAFPSQFGQSQGLFSLAPTF